MAHEFKHMLSPVDVGPVRMRNRVYFAPHDTNFMPPNTPPSQRAIAYYMARAKGGVAAIVTPNLLGVTASGAALPAKTLTNREAVSDYRTCVDSIHEHETRVLAQLTMVGRMGQTRPAGGTTISASPVRLDMAPFCREVPREMSTADINEAVRLFETAAGNARLAGFDGIEIMGAGGLLLHQFLSPALNKRTDAYGGSTEGRMRLILEIVHAVREAVGPGMAIGLKLAGDDFYDGGLELDESRRIAAILDDSGELDYITVVGGMYVSVPTHVPPMYYPLGCFVYLASEMRRVVKHVNINCMGRINDPAQVNRIISDNHADMVGMVRGLICDPAFVKKSREGRTDEIRQCVGCEEGCYGRFRRGLPITCAYNPEAGRESELSIDRVEQRKKVMVIGAGVAGMETARVAALRGHKVSVHEMAAEIGGQVRVAARAPRRDDFGQISRYYAHQFNLLGVDVHLSQTVSTETVETEKPDVVVVATGSTPKSLAGYDGGGANVVDVRSVLEGSVAVGHSVLVVAQEHGTEALSVADYLSDRGRQVQVVTEFFYAGSEAPFGVLQALYTRLSRKQVPMLTLTAVHEVCPDSVVVRNVFSGFKTELQGIDTVVTALGSEARDGLSRDLSEKGWNVVAVGDCVQPRLLPQVTHEAAVRGRAI